MARDNRVTGARIHDLARSAAERDLKEIHEAEYRLLLDGWKKHYREELGYVDLRPAENRSRDRTRAKRDEGGRFA